MSSTSKLFSTFVKDITNVVEYEEDVEELMAKKKREGSSMKKDPLFGDHFLPMRGVIRYLPRKNTFPDP